MKSYETQFGERRRGPDTGRCVRVPHARAGSDGRAAATRPGRGRAGTVSRPGWHGDLQRRDQHAIGPRAAGARDLAASLPQVPARRDTAELASTSTTSTVSVIAAGPLTPGVTYEFWLVGHNFRGDGPESNHVTHAVPVGP